MFKKLFSFVLAFVVAVQPLQAHAGDLGQALSNVMGPGSAATASAPGRYTAGARNVFVGGGVEMRFPRSNVTLFSIAPPSYSAGCQGISAHFGGISFISGKEIEALVRNIAQGAPGMVINMVIKALCPMCEAVLQNMQKLAQFAAKANMDSCRVAGNLATMLQDKVFPTDPNGEQAVAGACGLKVSSVNKDSEWGKANATVCNSLKGSVETLKKHWAEIEDGMYGSKGDSPGAPGTKQGTAADQCATGIGNCTWLVLTEMYPARDNGSISDENIQARLLLMNLMGATLVGPGATCGGAAAETPLANPKNINTVTCLPKLDAHTAVGLFMCGVPAEGTSPSAFQKTDIWKEYCRGMFSRMPGAQASAPAAPAAPGAPSAPATPAPAPTANPVDDIRGLALMDCALVTGGKETNAYAKCETLKQSTVADMKLVQGPGFLFQVQDLLREAVSRVRNNQPMGKDEKGQRIIKLVNMAPYPLYQAINAAAVYPEAGEDLIDSLSLLVADHMAYAYFQQLITKSTDYGPLTISPKNVNKILDGMQALRMQADLNKSRMGKTMASQQLVMEEIRKVNVVIQQSVMSEQMLNMQKYANTINTQASEPSTTGK